jgi:hypothetical protein
MPLGLLHDLAQDPLKVRARFFSFDFVRHLDEAFRLLRIVGRRLGFARHAAMVARDHSLRERDVGAVHIAEGAQIAAHDGAGPPVEPIYEAGGGADLPPERQQDLYGNDNASDENRDRFAHGVLTDDSTGSAAKNTIPERDHAASSSLPLRLESKPPRLVPFRVGERACPNCLRQLTIQIASLGAETVPVLIAERSA